MGLVYNTEQAWIYISGLLLRQAQLGGVGGKKLW